MSSVNSPCSIGSTPLSVLSRVVFPEPLLPIIPSTSPSFTSKDTLSNACTSVLLSNLNFFDKFFTFKTTIQPHC